jgi:hypothetical protein
MFHALQHTELPSGGTLIKKVAKLLYHKTALMGNAGYISAFWQKIQLTAPFSSNNQ